MKKLKQQSILIGNYETSDFLEGLQEHFDKGFSITQSSINNNNIVILVFEKEEVINNG